MPSITDTRRRYSKTSSSKKSSPTSATASLFLGKGRSNSTPNPEPVSRLNTRQSKQNGSKEQPIDEQSNENARLMVSYAEPSETAVLPDVFTFLEKEDGFHSEAEDEGAGATIEGGPVSASPHPEIPMPNTPHYSDLEVHAAESHEQDVWGSPQHDTSFHSDSGISMDNSSPEVKSRMPKRRQSSIYTGTWPDDTGLDPFREEPYGFKGTSSPIPLPTFASLPQNWTSMPANLEDTPEAYYTTLPHVIPKIAPCSRTTTVEDSSPAASQAVQEGLYQHENPLGKSNSSGYDLLASSIDSKSEEFLRPIYRKFETLNNRMLLYLQDEISEIEDRLRELDSTITQESQYYGSRPASRRIEARYPSHLQLQRMDLLARSFAKVEQYNRALSSYSNLTKILEPASAPDIRAYREWITKHAPIAKEETTFLEHEADLVVAATSKTSIPLPAPSRHDRELQAHVIVVAFTLVSTVIVFRVVPQLLARLVISAMVGVASLCTLQPAVLSDLRNIRDWRKGITIYVAVMLVLAIVVG